jgi:hypothetical protein
MRLAPRWGWGGVGGGGGKKAEAGCSPCFLACKAREKVLRNLKNYLLDNGYTALDELG